jgi:serine O-acetyltransferase
MKTINPSSVELTDYVFKQINCFFPAEQKDLKKILRKNMEESIRRTLFCINNIKIWNKNEFNILNSSQYATFLWYLSNSVWKNTNDEIASTKIFYLNKALNGFECFYDNNLPEIFLLGHTVGIVLCKNIYKNYLVLFQGVTVGRQKEDRPEIAEKVILFPYSSVVGKSYVGEGTVVSRGINIIEQRVEGNCYVFQNGKDIITKNCDGKIFNEYFRF